MAVLDEKGRCCGRKPHVYRGKYTTREGPHRFCSRCNRAYDLEENHQIKNWAWKPGPDGEFVAQLSGRNPINKGEEKRGGAG